MGFRYDTVVDPNAGDTSQTLALAMIGHNKRVLEFGCATGYMTEALKRQGCKVFGVEMDEESASKAREFAEQLIVGDLDSDELWADMPEDFDAMLFGDVLEHLRDPVSVLRKARPLLKPSGCIVVSLPNVAHGDVRLALLQGEFPYRSAGLLDSTHLHFYTRDSAFGLLHDGGFVVTEVERVPMPLFGTEVGVRPENFDPDLVKQIREDPESETYQFVVKAVLDNGDSSVASMAARIAAFDSEALQLTRRVEELSAQLDAKDDESAQLRQALESRLAEADGERAALQADLHAVAMELDSTRQELEALMRTKSFRTLAPFRRVYGALRKGAGE